MPRGVTPWRPGRAARPARFVSRLGSAREDAAVCEVGVVVSPDSTSWTSSTSQVAWGAAPLWSTGAGTALLNATDEFFRLQNCARAEVTSGDHRPAPHSFYEAHGFAPDERRFVKRYAPR